MTVRVTAGESMESPAAANRTARRSSIGGVSLSRKPVAPTSSARNTSSSVWNVVSTMTDVVARAHQVVLFVELGALGWFLWQWHLLGWQF
jgi:hypothetical protein